MPIAVPLKVLAWSQAWYCRRKVFVCASGLVVILPWMAVAGQNYRKDPDDVVADDADAGVGDDVVAFAGAFAGVAVVPVEAQDVLVTLLRKVARCLADFLGRVDCGDCADYGGCAGYEDYAGCEDVEDVEDCEYVVDFETLCSGRHQRNCTYRELLDIENKNKKHSSHEADKPGAYTETTYDMMGRR